MELFCILAEKSQVEALWPQWESLGSLPAGVLELCGRFGLTEATEQAWKQVCQGDWAESGEAVLCLANLPLGGLEADIRSALDEAEGRGLFHEHLPILAPLVHWPNCLERLTNWADQASTDCLGGIVLGTALCPEPQAQDATERLLCSSRYECYGGGTGLEWFSELAGRVQGLDILWLAQRIRQTKREPQKAYLFKLLRSWLRKRLAWHYDPVSAPPPASLGDVSKAIFSRGTDPSRDDSLLRLVPSELSSEFYHLKDGYERELVLEGVIARRKLD